jgi:hypothetical protein
VIEPDAGVVLQLLAESRIREKAQALFYRWLAAEAEMARQETEVERLHELHADEQHHLSRVTARLLELRGTAAELEDVTVPTVSLLGWEDAARLREAEEISWYRGVLAAGLDAGTRALVEAILESEKHHHAELRGKWMSA